MTAAWLIAACLVGQTGPRPPNVVIFLTDDQGYNDLGCQGSKDIRSPRIDRLAAEGVRFRNWYSAAPVCSPSRAALLTGRSPQGAGVAGNVSSRPGRPGMPPAQLTIAERLGRLGYATGAVGKWHLGSSPGADPVGQGFGRFFGFHAGCIDNYSHTFYWEEPPHFHDLWRDDREVHEDGTYFNDLVTREAVRFVEANRDRPFFLYVAYNLPHYPMQAPQRLLPPFEGLRPDRATYAAMVAAVDESVGTVVDRLDGLGLGRDTLVVFLSDHGASAEARANGPVGDNGPYRGRKFSLFDGGLRVPCVVRWPGRVPAGLVRGQIACSFDLAPTILRAAGGAPAPADPPMEGVDLGPTLVDDAPIADRTLCWKSGTQEAARAGRWKLVREARGGNPAAPKVDSPFLADLEADPGESRNLAGDHPDVVDRLGRAVDRWLAAVAP